MKQRNTNRRVRRGLATLAVVGASVVWLGWTSFEGVKKLENFREQGRPRVCLSGEYDTIPPTSADMDCGRVVMNHGYGNIRLVAPQKAPSQEGCDYPFTLEADGRCHYFPPRSEDI